MKKLLALVLAMVMTLGLATVSSSAAYSDAADVSLKEAVDVMSTVGVFQGADGKFSPKANLNREQAAKLIAYLDLGETTAEALPAVKVFSDVEATRWSAKYIAYCADAGYIAGDGTGKFNPAGELSGYAFGKMVLCVLGYDAQVEGFTGNNWSIAVAKLMEKNDIADGVDGAASATLTREQAAQYCLNALQATVVDYESKGTNVTINGAVIATGASAAKAEAARSYSADDYIDYTANNGHAKKNAATNNTLQLCEKLYGTKLTKKTTEDDFNREGTQWTYTSNGKVDTTDVFADAADYTFVAAKAIAKKDDGYATLLEGVNKALGFTKTSDKLKLADGAKAYVNGEEVASKDLAVSLGDVVEVYAEDGKINNIVIRVYTLGEIDKVDTDVSAKDADNDVTAYVTIKDDGTFNDTDIAGYNAATYTKGTKVAYIVKDKAVIDSYIPEVVSGVSFSGKASDGKTAAAGGTTYTAYQKKAEFFDAVKLGADNTYDLYLDASGSYVLGYEAVSTDKSLDDLYYVVASFKKDAIKDEYGKATNYGYVQVVALDGTVSSVTLENDTKADAIVGQIVSFSKVSKKDYMAATAYANGNKYDDFLIRAVAVDELKTSTKTLSGQYLNSDTQYVIVSTKSEGNPAKLNLAKTSASVKTGGVAYKDAKGWVISHKSGTSYVADCVVLGEATASAASDKLFVKGSDNLTSYSTLEDKNGDAYNSFTVYDKTGAKIQINAGTATSLTNGFNEYEVDADGVYTLKHVEAKSIGSTAPWTKSFTGTLENVKFKSYYGGLLAVESSEKILSEITASAAAVVDLHDTDAAKQYDKTVSSLETLDTLLNGSKKITGADLSLDIDEDGAIVIFINTISVKE